MRRFLRSATILVALVAALGATAVLVDAYGQSPARVNSPADAPHLVIVPNSERGRAALSGAPARTIATYGAFTLVEADGAVVARLIAAGGEMRDDMREVRIGVVSSDPSLARPSLRAALRAGAAGVVGADHHGLAVVQYVGPLKDSWIAAVRATGVEVVSYMAQNGQLVSGDAGALAALAQLSGGRPFIRAVTPYGAEDKLLPGLNRSGTAEVVVSTVAGRGGEAARAALARIATPRGDALPVAGIVQHRVSVDSASLGRIAELGGVVAVEPFVEPRLLDERAATIVSGRLNGAFQPILGAGYRTYLQNHGFSTAPGPVIDITDGGIDKGVVPAPPGSHPDFYRSGNTANASRLVYAQEATAADSNARDCGGHGTSVASIAAGFNSATGAANEDAQGFNYGLGIAPFARLGATKIFNCAGNFDVTTSITSLHSNAFAGGARISNNSWGAAVGGAYNTTSQEFDALVRDAQPGVAGNQQLVEVVGAGNSGPGANTISSPATAKNVIAVGASENVRPMGATDGCGVTDAQANSARDIVDFSSRGPTDDGRTKPDVLAPGTHLTGAQPQTGAEYNGSGVCNPQFPAGSSLYSITSSTSVATPHVSGLAALIREWYLTNLGGGTRYPSPAMTKALIINTATDLSGGDNGAGAVVANAPAQDQGWGRINLNPLLDGTRRRVVDQGDVFAASGAARNRFYTVWRAARPLRVTLVWTDAVGPTTGNAFVNDLNLEVTAGGVTYKGNVFADGHSAAGGAADPRNNVENVFLPPGIAGAVKVRVVATNIAGDGVPGNADTTDQDYALVVSNVIAPTGSAVILKNAGVVVDLLGDGDSFLEPGELFTLRQRLKNVGNVTATSLSGVLSAAASEATIVQSSSNWPSIAPNTSAASSPLFRARVKSTLSCGDFVDLSIAVSGSGSPFNLPVRLPTGRPQATGATLASNDVPKAIPDNDPAGASSALAIGTPGFVADIDVTIGQITHPFVGDLRLELLSPTGTTVVLANRIGGGGDNFTSTVFDDAAATSITSGAAPFTGSFRPIEPLSAFNGEQSQGTWTLIVRDLAADDSGTLSSWDLTRKRYICD